MNTPQLATLLKTHIRTVRGWPHAGVNFRDVTTLFAQPAVFRAVVDALGAEVARCAATRLACVDARGFILGGALGDRLGVPFFLVRKKGKLPARTIGTDYALEYGTASIEIHADSCQPGERVLIIDDLIATGGTALAAAELVRRLGAQVVGLSALVDLPELGGAERLRAAGIPVHALCTFTEHE
jgi:adenine phosphoribosyltransferase